MKRIFAVAVGTMLFLAACSHMEYSITLEEDLSGTATLEMALDLGKMAHALAAMQKTFSGDTTELTEEELAAARTELMVQMDEEEWNEEEARADASQDLPEGVELLEFSNAREDLLMQFRIKLGFDHVSKLNQVSIDPSGAAGGAGTPGDESQPFGGLEVIEEGNTVVLRNDPLDRIEEQVEEASGQVGPIDGMMESVLEDFSVVFRIDAPFDVVEHNATRQEGRVLIWEYDESSLQEGADGVFVRYRR